MPTIVPIKSLESNYIWIIIDQQRQQCVVVDPGEPHAVLALLRQQELDLAAILITHHHHDHVGGIEGLMAYQTTTVYGPQREADAIPHLKHRVTANDNISVMGLDFSILDIPGHTRGHLAYLANIAQQQCAFTGDTLFSAGCGRLFEGSAQQLWHSLERLKQLPAQTLVYCAHEYTLANLRFAQAVEPNNSAIAEQLLACQALKERQQPTLPSTIGKERMINPFLRCDQTTVQQAAANYADTPLDNELAVFTVLRQWKDQF